MPFWFNDVEGVRLADAPASVANILIQEDMNAMAALVLMLDKTQSYVYVYDRTKHEAKRTCDGFVAHSATPQAGADARTPTCAM